MDFDAFTKLKSLDGPVLITGHTGFKGTWLTLLLREMGIATVGLSLPAEKESLYNRMARKGSIPEEFIDINDRALTLKCVESFAPAVVVHLAAQPIVRDSYLHPVETFSTNVLGTAHILDACMKVKSVKAVGVVTTDKVYRNEESGIPFKETDPLGGKDPYSASKSATESVVAAWQEISRNDSGPRIVALRSGNVIGGGDFAPDRLLPDLIRAISLGRPLIVRNPLSTRPWQHVLDSLFGYLLAVEYSLRDPVFSDFNFGPEEGSLEVREVLKVAQDFLGSRFQVQFQESESSNKRESVQLQLDSSRAREVLSWGQCWSQESAVLATLNWWTNLEQGHSSGEELCASEIRKVLDFTGFN
jgi:CDP-glucose 4,6-dehydratase